MIHDFEGETAAADDDWCKLLVADKRCNSKSLKTGGAADVTSDVLTSWKRLVADRRCCSELLHSSKSIETGGAES